MSRFSLLIVCFASVIWLSGCGGANSESDSKPSTSGGDANKVDSAKIKEALAALSDVDHNLAEAQKNCPVVGGPLGAMGTPIQLDVKGQPVFICCEGCKDTIMKDPDTYLAKLKKE